MVGALLDGAAHTADELASVAAVSSATASQHLAVLLECGIVTSQRQGRHRFYRLANARLAHALEQLSTPDLPPPTSLRLTREQARVRQARTCYDHLAGQLGVAVADRFVEAAWTDAALSTLTPAGRAALPEVFGIDLEAALVPGSRRPMLRACRDWTEQRDHLAGTLGALLADMALTRDWVRRKEGSRALTITASGRETLTRAGVDCAHLR